MHIRFTKYLLLIIIVGLFSCNGGSGRIPSYGILKGVYSFGPEVRSFKDCDNGQEYWVADNSGQLELKYTQLKFEKAYEPVYIEVEGVKVRSGKDGLGAEYDSTLVVKKLIKITKEIPLDMCN